MVRGVDLGAPTPIEPPTTKGSLGNSPSHEIVT